MNTLKTAQRGRSLVEAELRRRGAKVTEIRQGRRVVLHALVPGRPDAVKLRVKTRLTGDWQVRITDGKQDPAPDRDRYWIFVDLSTQPARLLVTPEASVQLNIYEEHERYLERHGGARAVTPGSTHHKISTSRVEDLDGGWSLLGL